MNSPPEFSPGCLLSEEVVRQWLESCGAGVKIFSGCRLVRPERVSIGDYSQIDEGVRIFAGEGVTIGRHVHLAFDCSISGGGRCLIHDFAGLGAGVRLITGTDVVGAGGLTNPTIAAPLRTVERGKVEVGPHAVVFTNSVVLPNVSIGEGAVVAAGSVVHHDLKPWAIYAGHPLVQVAVRSSKPVLAKARELLESEDGRQKPEDAAAPFKLRG